MKERNISIEFSPAIKAIDELSKSGKGLLRAEVACRMAEPFGIIPAFKTIRQYREEIGFLILNKETSDNSICIATVELAEQICEKLEIDFLPNLLNLDTNDTFKGDFGYRHLKEVHQQGKPDEQNLDKWIIALEDQQIWRVAHDYLHLLGQETIEQMGYSYTELQQLIDEHRPLWIRSWRTLSLSKLLKQNEPYRTWYGSWQAEF